MNKTNKMSQTTFTITEIKRYLNEQEDLAVAYGHMTAEAIIDANLWHVYNIDADWECNIKPLNEFKTWVLANKIGPNQIAAYPAIDMFDDIRYNKEIEICLHQWNHSQEFLNNIPDTCTHVVWFSK